MVSAKLFLLLPLIFLSRSARSRPSEPGGNQSGIACIHAEAPAQETATAGKQTPMIHSATSRICLTTAASRPALRCSACPSKIAPRYRTAPPSRQRPNNSVVARQAQCEGQDPSVHSNRPLNLPNGSRSRERPCVIPIDLCSSGNGCVKCPPLCPPDGKSQGAGNHGQHQALNHELPAQPPPRGPKKMAPRTKFPDGASSGAPTAGFAHFRTCNERPAPWGGALPAREISVLRSSPVMCAAVLRPGLLTLHQTLKPGI